MDSWKKVPNFLISTDSAYLFYDLTDEEAGRIIKAIFVFAETGEVLDMSTEDRLARTTYAALIAKVREDKEKYLLKCLKNQENGAKGGHAKAENARTKQTLATASNR